MNIRRWNAMMLEVGMDMLVMRMIGLQRRIVGMRLIVVPVLLVATAIDFIADIFFRIPKSSAQYPANLQ